jgi:hypothetical protein
MKTLLWGGVALGLIGIALWLAIGWRQLTEGLEQQHGHPSGEDFL